MQIRLGGTRRFSCEASHLSTLRAELNVAHGPVIAVLLRPDVCYHGDAESEEIMFNSVYLPIFILIHFQKHYFQIGFYDFITAYIGMVPFTKPACCPNT